MGKKNDLLNQYLEKTDVFAELCNAAIYGGKKVIRPQELADMQRNYGRKISGRDGIPHRVTRARDAAKLLCHDAHFVKIAFENQDSLHFCMPLRCMEYDGMELSKQLAGLRRRHKADNDLEGGAEYLSGIKETDRLIPVMTIVFYHGRGQWTAARRLSGMLDTAGMDNAMRRMLPDYRMNVVCLEDLKEEHFQTGLHDLIALMKRREDKEAFSKYLEDNRERLDHLDEELYILICTMLNLSVLNRCREKYYNKETGDYRMCTAVWEMKQDGIEIGKKRGIEIREKRMGLLAQKLTVAGRGEELLRAVEDEAVRSQLYLEFGI